MEGPKASWAKELVRGWGGRASSDVGCDPGCDCPSPWVDMPPPPEKDMACCLGSLLWVGPALASVITTLGSLKKSTLPEEQGQLCLATEVPRSTGEAGACPSSLSL